jgi:hypothetical protein
MDTYNNNSSSSSSSTLCLYNTNNCRHSLGENHPYQQSLYLNHPEGMSHSSFPLYCILFPILMLTITMCPIHLITRMIMVDTIY